VQRKLGQRLAMAGARRDLLDEIATETQFDRRLLAIGFPSPIEQQVQALVTANGGSANVALWTADTNTVAAGSHTLIVQPFSGLNGTGLGGAFFSVTFKVTG